MILKEHWGNHHTEAICKDALHQKKATWLGECDATHQILLKGLGSSSAQISISIKHAEANSKLHLFFYSKSKPAVMLTIQIIRSFELSAKSTPHLRKLHCNC